MRKIIRFVVFLVMCCCLLAQTSIASSYLGMNVKDFGAVGDGQTDDTAAIQKTLNMFDHVYIPDGTYLINPGVSLRPHSGQTLTLSDSAVLKALPSAQGYNNIIMVAQVSDVTITGGTIVGERDEHIGTSGQWGMGIKIANGASNIEVNNLTVANCWGDGFYIGDNESVNHVLLDHVISYNNRRAGLSITNASDVKVSNSVFMYSNGINLCSGLNMEPNASNEIKNITLENVECKNNSGRGLSLSGFKGIVSDIKISNCNFHNNKTAGMFIETVKNLTCADTSCSVNKEGITILSDTYNAQFTNINLFQNFTYGFSIDGNKQKSGIESVSFSYSNFFDNGQNMANRYDGALIYSDETGYINNITFSNCNFYDDQSEPTQRYGINISTAEKVSNIAISGDCTYSGNIRGDYYSRIPFPC